MSRPALERVARQALSLGGRALRWMRSSSARALGRVAGATWRGRHRVHLAAAACVLLGAAAMASGLWLGGLRQPHAERRAPGAPAAQARSGVPGHAAAANPSRARLLIPAIGVDAPVEPVGTDSAGDMAAPSTPQHVGWYRGGPAPGDPGDAVIDGHLDWTTGPAVFWRLGQLKPGDGIIVEMPGHGTSRFLVDSLTMVPYTAHPVGLFATSGPPRLSLVTCGGSFDRSRGTYLQRLIVDAQLAPAEADPSPSG